MDFAHFYIVYHIFKTFFFEFDFIFEFHIWLALQTEKLFDNVIQKRNEKKTNGREYVRYDKKKLTIFIDHQSHILMVFLFIVIKTLAF